MANQIQVAPRAALVRCILSVGWEIVRYRMTGGLPVGVVRSEADAVEDAKLAAARTEAEPELEAWHKERAGKALRADWLRGKAAALREDIAALEGLLGHPVTELEGLPLVKQPGTAEERVVLFGRLVLLRAVDRFHKGYLPAKEFTDYGESVAGELREASKRDVEERATQKRNRASEQSLDAQAVAVVDMFEDPRSRDYRPGWRVKDVAEILKCASQALTSKQRDRVTPRCPKFARRREKAMCGPLSRQKRTLPEAQ